MALGADPHTVRGMVLRYAAALMIPGVVLGLLGAWLGSRWIEGLLFEVNATDPVTFASAVLVLRGM